MQISITLTDLLAAVPALLSLSPSGRILVHHRHTSVRRSHIGLSISRTHTFIKLHENGHIQQTEIQGSHDLGNAPFIEMCLYRDSNYDSVAVANAVVELETPSAHSPPLTRQPGTKVVVVVHVVVEY